MTNIAAKIDAWLERQADDYWDRPEPCTEEDDCQCTQCEAERKQADDEARADAMYAEWKLSRVRRKEIYELSQM